uniref:Tetratricopeptide repeat domain 6 n=1 Tax=Callorhinchus milii TaxID=7868 RepID=A0A4W3GKT1_CALMI
MNVEKHQACLSQYFNCPQFYLLLTQTALGSSRVQQAAIQTFLKHYDRAIDCLAAVDPSPVLCILLGKTQMKAKKFEVMYIFESKYDIVKYAFESFNKALKLFPLYALAYYQRGLCRMGLQETNYIQDFHRALDINPNLRAIFYGLQGRYFKALLSCNKALMIQPKSVRVFIYRGTLKFFIKAYKTAIADLNSAIAIDNVCSLAFFNRAVCYHQINEYDKVHGEKPNSVICVLLAAHITVSRGTEYRYFVLQPTNDKICHALGFCKHKIGQLTKAVNVFTKAVKLNPFFVDAYFGRGNVYMDYRTAAGTKEAQKDFLRALHLDPLCEKARISLAYNFQVLGRYQKAWNHFTIAIDNNPNFQDAYEGRAVINLQMNDTFAAFQDINAALKISKSAKLLTNRGVINQFMGHLPSAMADYKMAITLDPKFSLAYFNAANLYFHNKQFKQADDYYTKAIDLDPGDESAVLNRAISRVLLQNVQGALEDFEQAIALSPFTAHIYFNRANLYFTLKQYSDAERDFSRALELKPDDALIYKLRADVRGKLGRNEDAISDYKKAIDVQNAIRNR